MQISQQLRICVFANICALCLVMFAILLFSERGDAYMRTGPQPDLYVLSVKIDTWSKYLQLQFFLLIIETVNVLVNDIAGPILGFNIYNPDKKIITELGKNELQIMANMLWMTNNIRSGLFVMINLSQIDVALLRIMYSEIATFFTIRILLNKKQFESPDLGKVV